MFGAARFSFDNGRLQAYANGAPFQVGLRRPRTSISNAFHACKSGLSANSPAQLRVVVRRRLEGAEFIGDPTTAAIGTHTLTLDLGALHWQRAGKPVSAPDVAAMLRLQVEIPAQQRFRLAQARLLRGAGVHALDLDHPVTLLDPDATPAANETAVSGCRART